MPAKDGSTVPISISHQMLAQIEFVAKRLGMSRQDAMRLSMRVGMEDLRRIDYRVDKSVVDRAAELFSETRHLEKPAAAGDLTGESVSCAVPAAPKKRAS